ncbi:MAG: RidA family protein [Desulfobacterales bacterium]
MKSKSLSILLSLALICSVILVTESFAEDAKPIYPAGIKPIAPYSPAIMYGDLLFISGQIPYVKGAIPENAKTDIKEQTKIVMENLKTVLSEAGMSFKNVLKATVFITDMKNYGAFNKVYGPYWTDNGLTPPARAAVEVGALPGSKPGAPVLVEVSMIAGK